MPEPSPEAVEALFQQATELDPAERGAFLVEQCAGDLVLKAAVLELLHFDSEAQSEPDFLETPAVGVRAVKPLAADPGLPAYIGRYRILRRHGEGGMGTVYEAEQDNPRRTVALKVIRPDLVSTEFLIRFKQEAQILGRLQHTGIAQVYEAGRGEDRQPFFAMEFIRGTPLDEYARGRGLLTPARLELLARVCDAVQHAHDKGVIHRDLKPGNILVDESGQPKVLDFGVAHITDANLLTTSRQTQTGQLLGTLNYMSPEQLAARPTGLDVRSDVYALGVILFELLAHRLPYHLDQLPVHEVARVIAQQEPALLGSIDKHYRGDVAIIVAKALAKDKRQRYTSAGDLGSDIRRYLGGEPILARKVSPAERYWRWARRNPFIAALGGILTGVLLLATVASLLAVRRFASLAELAGNSAKRERAARLDADVARQAAEAAGAAAQAETYRAVLSEVKALRAGHQLGWREEALEDLSRLVRMRTPRRDVVELRTEAVATIGDFGVKEVARLEVSGGIVYSIDFSPDSRTLVTASTNRDVDYWGVQGRKHLRRLVGVARTVTGAAAELNGGQVRFLPDGDLAILTPGPRVSFLGASGRESTRRPAIERANPKVVKLAIDRQGRWLALGFEDGRIDVVDAGTGAARRSFARNLGTFAFSPDGNWLAVQAQYGPVRLLPMTGGGPAFTLGHLGGYYPAFAFSPDGTTIATVADRALVLWDLSSKEELMRLGGHKESITAVAFSPDGALVATTCGDHVTRIWDARDGRALAVLPGPWLMRALAFSPDRGYLAVSAHPGPVCLYQLTGWREQRRLVGHKFGAQCLAVHPRLPRFASGADDSAIVVWDADEARIIRRWQPYRIWVTGLAYSPDGSLLASALGNSDGYPFANDHSIHLWDAEDGTLRKRFPRPPHLGVRALAFDPTGRRLASGDDGGTVLLWDVESGKILRRENLARSPVRSAVFVNGGRHLIVGHVGGTVASFDLGGTGGTRRVELPQGGGCLVVDDRRMRVLAGGAQGELSALALPDLTVVHQFANAHDGEILSVGLSPDGRLLATSGRDRRVILRDAETFEPWFTFPTWTGLVKDLAFDSSGRWLAFAGADSDLALWDLHVLHQGLDAASLAWDQPSPATVPASGITTEEERLRPAVPVIGPLKTDAAAFEQAHRLVQSGVGAFESGRWAAAIGDLKQARDRLRTLHQAIPSDGQVASELAVDLRVLGSALFREHRDSDALEAMQEARQVLDAIVQPNFVDLYNLARVCASLTALVETGRARPTFAEREALADQGVEALRRSLAAGMPNFGLMDRDQWLDPLRNRPDFRALMLDIGFTR
jgi:WD40 repeat protein/predicted Ser/Thr protein kinase